MKMCLEVQFMNLYIEARVLDIADYIVETGATVRAAASVFGVSKSTVHKDITERLRQINKVLGEQVAAVLETNKDERQYLHISEERHCAHTSDG